MKSRKSKMIKPKQKNLINLQLKEKLKKLNTINSTLVALFSVIITFVGTNIASFIEYAKNDNQIKYEKDKYQIEKNTIETNNWQQIVLNRSEEMISKLVNLEFEIKNSIREISENNIELFKLTLDKPINHNNFEKYSKKFKEIELNILDIRKKFIDIYAFINIYFFSEDKLTIDEIKKIYMNNFSEDFNKNYNLIIARLKNLSNKNEKINPGQELNLILERFLTGTSDIIYYNNELNEIMNNIPIDKEKINFITSHIEAAIKYLTEEAIDRKISFIRKFIILKINFP